MNREKFYQMIGTGIRRYLPMGYQEYQVHIKEAEISGEKKALLVMEKEGMKHMPVMSLETYLDRMKGGEVEKAVLIDIAVDYARMVSIQRRSQHRQMAR